MPNKHFCQGPTCHEQVTQDRFLKSSGVIRGNMHMQQWTKHLINGGGNQVDSDKYFCSQSCKFELVIIEHGKH